MTKVFTKLISIILHGIAFALIVYVFLPIAQWYFEGNPLWGVDFYYTVTLTNLIKDNFAFPPGVWNYAWFSGWPLLSNFPILHYYAILPLLAFFDILSAVKIWMLVSLALFFLGCYASFYLLSRSRSLSFILSIAAIYSVGVYGTLMWGGSLPNHATQVFFPWTIFFLISYLRKHDIRFLLAATLLAGFAILAHPQIVIAYIYPTAAILLFFSFGQLKFVKRIQALVLFLLVSFLIGLPILYTSFGSAISTLFVKDAFKVASSTARLDSGSTNDVIEFHRRQPERIYVDTNTTIFAFLAVSVFFFLFTFVLRRKGKMIVLVFPFIVLTIYFVVYIWIYSYGISIYHGGWYRLFWSTPLWLGLLVCSFWGTANDYLQEILKKFGIVFSSIFEFVIMGVGLLLLMQFSHDLRERIIPRSNPSSAFPDVLNLRSTKEGFEMLKTEMVPQWIDPNKTDYRIYIGDQTINIWWNALYKMPLARGYFDPPSDRTRGYIFWLDAALSIENHLVETFKYLPTIAFNNTLFLIDWYAIKFIEAGPSMATNTGLPQSLLSEEFIQNQEKLDFNKERYNHGGEDLNYYQLKDELVTPVFSATNAPTIGIFGSDEGYEIVVRAFADSNFNSQKLVPVKLGLNLDQYSEEDFKNFDALFLYDYKYKNRDVSFKKISKYIEDGGKVFVDTGVEVPESEEKDGLPEIFPIGKTVRKSLGKVWDFEAYESPLTDGIDFSSFDPPIFDEDPWKLSFPEYTDDVTPRANIILKNQGFPVLVSKKIGKGEIIWSGLNLPYHVIRFHNLAEIPFFENIIKELISGKTTDTQAVYSASFISSQERKITVGQGKAVLLKEQNYPGWEASVTSKGEKKTTRIWSAGPAYPGFMYIKVPEEFSGKEAIVHIKYNGSFTSWIISLFSLFVSLSIFELVVLRGFFLGRISRYIISFASKRAKSWWGKEDE